MTDPRLKSNVLTSISQARESEPGMFHIVQGRARTVRRMKNYWFVDIEDWTGRIQIIVGRELAQGVDVERGMLCTVSGELVFSKSGELSIYAQNLSAKDFGDSRLRDIAATRLNDLSPGSSTHRNLQYRSRAFQEMRAHLYESGFAEVDTGFLLKEPFAGSAKPLSAPADSLGHDVHFRGTIELGLKRLIAAGWPQVFEIGMCGRNESAPLLEYAMLEAMWANVSSGSMLDLVTEMTDRLSSLALRQSLGSSQGLEQLQQPWITLSFRQALEQRLKIDPWTADKPSVARAFANYGLVVNIHSTTWEREFAAAGYGLLRLHAHEFSQPTFVNKFPKSISPLAALHAESEDRDVSIADRGYGFLGGWRVFEVVQEDMHWASLSNSFAIQNAVGVSHFGESRSEELESYLSHGAPDASGLGFNINRFIGVVTGSDRLEEVAFFPLSPGRLPR